MSGIYHGYKEASEPINERWLRWKLGGYGYFPATDDEREQLRLLDAITEEAQALYFAAASVGVEVEIMTAAALAEYDPTLNTRRELRTLPEIKDGVSSPEWFEAQPEINYDK